MWKISNRIQDKQDLTRSKILEKNGGQIYRIHYGRETQTATTNRGLGLSRVTENNSKEKISHD